MFGRMMKNYYYGKSGQGDFRKDDMPETRMQLFWDTLRTRLSALCRLSMMYFVIWIPACVVILLNISNLWNQAQTEALYVNYDYSEYVEIMKKGNMEVSVTEDEYNLRRNSLMEQNRILEDTDYNAYLERIDGNESEALTQEQFEYVRSYYSTKLQNDLIHMLLILFPCIAITGPFTAGICYVTRNWARDEHAFIWTDFRDAVKENWKIPLLLSTITGIMPLIISTGWFTYSQMAARNMIMIVPQMLVVVVGILWALCITYMHPITVSYDLKAKNVLRNGFLLGVARLPMSVGIRLLHCVPSLIAVGAVWFFGLDPMLAIVLLFGYYGIIGLGLSRFVTASYTNAVFDRFINSRIKGAKINQGLRPKEDFDDEDDEEEAKQEETEE